ncbi:MAG: aldo/keto reductase [Jatrophihabitans sp.]|nr:aldo/keto reductase [Jatrophihabitans sp.]
MEYRRLGRTGVRVSSLCLGAMGFGGWANDDRADAESIIHRAIDAGVNFIDTADAYSFGESEEIVGRALGGGLRDDVVLATKGYFPTEGGLNHGGLSRRWLTRAVENSLRRLDTDHIDLYQVHRLDPTVDLEETLAVLTDLQRAGKIRYFGSSSFPAHKIVEAQWVAERRGLARYVTEQPRYSILARGIEADVLPVAQQFDLGVLTWSPLANGWLTGAFRRGVEFPQTNRAGRLPEAFDMSRAENQLKLDRVEALVELADQAGLTLIQLALAFVVGHLGVTSAIIGPRTHDHLDSQLAAAGVILSDDVLDRIDAIVPPGTVGPVDGGFAPEQLVSPVLRRRPPAGEANPVTWTYNR